MSSDTSNLVELFKSIGLSQSKAAEAAKSQKSAAVLRDLVETPDYGVNGRVLDEKQASLLAAFAKIKEVQDLGVEERKYAVHAILDGRLKTTDQVTAAAKHLESHRAPVDSADFDKECGVGFSITPEDLFARVSDFITSQAEKITGWSNLGAAMNGLKSIPDLRWANALEMKNAAERVFTEKFGAKGSAPPKLKEPKNGPTESKKKAVATDSTPSTSTRSVFEEGFLGALHKPGENPQIHSHLREQHLAATGGKVFTRFPPEPNGFLHIGHSKAIFINFGYAAHHGGHCYLRYDDTNPEAEEGRYFESILETVRWLGYEPWKITYSSDYFERLYELAEELIQRGKAYMCQCSEQEIKANRGLKVAQPKPCVHREKSVADSLSEFRAMKEGKYKEGEAVLRMKQDLTDGNPYMWDLIAYRVVDAPHHRTGTQWKIYPTYDFTHCLVDSFENISHSLCTVEFIAARQSYEWLCDALEVYKPRQSEYGRLNLTGTVMSKRKILALVNEGHVRDWDDPRLYTLIALRRRGVPPGAIVSFVSSLGVSTSPSTLQLARFEQAVRQYLENSAPRLLMVLRPLKVTLDNVPEDYVEFVEKPLHPKVPELGISRVPFARTLYIDRDDFRLQDSKEYFRLAPGKTVGLFSAPAPITCTSFKTDDNGEVTELICKLEQGSTKKPKAFIQWVAEHRPSGSPVIVDETRIFHPLFKSDNPAAAPDFRADINPSSLEVISGAMIEVGFWSLAKRSYVQARIESKARTAKAKQENPEAAAASEASDTPEVSSEQLIGKECVRFQGLRVAYFALDKTAKVGCLDMPDDSPAGPADNDRIVLNRIVSLKEDSGKAVV
ncbi:glutamine-tRNA ligase [Punctularia strigosozonata HHB-11173 SS5]|uniref:glutamine-tRNA ligase n=1 Tax=Punctularia strigosozonata (strain HHB-11173) TaxID=741275 RepID=UPI0004417FAD|nr:glutamine-tRNA ligase [Punctularia strigosozonata HHB-11173 SS5]EIN10891.1 glutamine-tRNA ligase [Punctularia strigosozonata HHB-11173 SS5]